MNHRPRPPRLARWILARTLPGDVHEDVAGDLEEMFTRRRAAEGPARAWRWYWTQAASFAVHFAAERVRDRQRYRDRSTGMSWIDFKLALRMLVRYPGLTLVGVLGMAVAIAISTTVFTIASKLMDPTLPLAGGERLVSIQNWDVRTNNRELRLVYDFAIWRDELRSLQDIGAFRTVGRNLIAPGGQPETVMVCEISPAGFAIAGVSPLLGRHLQPDDERPGAPPVVVLGEDLWRRRFGGDPSVVGRDVQLGHATYTVVGVMPPGFAFPVEHDIWIPLPSAVSPQPRSGPMINVFARLAPGVSFERAQAELAALGQRSTASFPATHEHLRPQLLPYTYAFTDMDDPDNALALHAMQSAIVLLLVLVSVNVAILVYARTASREGEIAVRTALGASRKRIVGQLFLEALVLAGVAAAVGIGFVALGLDRLDSALEQLGLGFPFWITFELSWTGILWVVGLTILAAAIVGVLPALKVTGRRVQTRLQGLSAGSGSRMQMGRLWTALIVAQVAVAVAILPATMYHTWSSLRFRSGDSGYAAGEFLTGHLVLERGPELVPSEAREREFRARYGHRLVELERRLESDAPVSHVTFSLEHPGEELAAVIEVEGMPPPADPVDYNIVEGSKAGTLVRFNRIAPDFFEAFDVPVLTGRGLRASDATPGAERILVNRAFVERVFAGANPLGRRVRYVGRSREAGERNVVLNAWMEIAGVVPDFPPYAFRNDGGDNLRLYHALRPGGVFPATLSIRVRGMDPGSFADRLRQVTAGIDPDLQLRNVSGADDAVRREQGLMRVIGWTLAAVTISVIVLAAAGIYALMSFTVARRRREIGIRAALGADPARILGGIFSRVFAQLAVGAILGMLASIGLEGVLEGEMYQGQGAIVLPLVAVSTVLVGLLAAIVPARRGLSIQPTEALREE